MKILIIEDDSKIVNMLVMLLTMRWPQAEIRATAHGEEGILFAGSHQYDAIILDLGLPDIDGLEVLKSIRGFSTMPIIILTVHNDESEIVRGLELGADEYITKPFSQIELLARINCVIRRKTNQYVENPVIKGELNLDWINRKLDCKGKLILLTATETKILHHLMVNANTTITVSSLAEIIWGEDYPGSFKAIRVYMRRLREKLEQDPSSPAIIITRPSLGYEIRLS
ncbi:MAG: response regulator transcription factor [Dehalogenimonas sp.]